MKASRDHFRAKLLERREALLEEERLSQAERAPVALDQESVGRLSRIDAMQVQAMALAQQRRRQAELGAVNSAVRRIEDGEYGYCIKCGEDIAPERLEHNPAITTCIECARGER